MIPHSIPPSDVRFPVSLLGGVLDVGRIGGFGGAGVLLFDGWVSARFEGW